MPPSAQHFSYGLRFRKLDLHVHTPASSCFADRRVTPDQIIQAAIARGLDGLAVTDHNSGGWIDRVKDAARGRPLTIFPGVELTCTGGKEGIHIIALFDPQCGTRDVESLLGNLGLTTAEYGNIAAVIQKDPISVAETVEKRGGLVVLAHANSSKGVLHDMRGQQRTNLVRSVHVHAAEGTDFQDRVAAAERKRVCDFLNGKDSTYQRKLATYQASDNPSGQNDGQHAIAGIGTRCAFFKLDKIDIDGLRQCFADPDVRIRQDFEVTPGAYPRISKIRVIGGFLDGAEAEFHEGLNSILGAKGAGKSLVVEFLRFALNQLPSNGDILADHQSKLESKLENYGVVEVGVLDDAGAQLTFSRMWDPAEGHPYTNEQARDPAEVFPVLFLSQNEIIKVAEDEAAQIAFIDQFLDFRQHQQEVEDLDGRLEELDKSLSDAFDGFQSNRDLQQQITVASKEIEQLDIALKNPVFDQYAKFEAKDQTLRERQTFLSRLATQIGDTREEYALVHPPDPPPACAGDPAVKRGADITNQAVSTVLQCLETAVAKLERVEETV